MMDNKVVENKVESKAKEYYTIDLMHVMKSLWHRAWLIALCGFLAAAIGFGLSAFVITPKYSSSVMLYVNNNSFTLGNTSLSISASEISAAQSLVKTYTEILKNRTTLERVIDKTGVEYTYEELYDMITAAPSNDTEIMKVTVTSASSKEASEIANVIAEVLPIRVSEIIDGASMEVVDSAVANDKKVSPSITKYTALGLLLGVFFAAAVLAIFAMMDDTIHSEDYVLQNYEFPILARVPNLLGSNGKNYKYQKHGYYYQSKSQQ